MKGNEQTKLHTMIANIQGHIYEIHGQKIMMDCDLAELYGVETKRLNEQVKRNIQRFPNDFMFIISPNEAQNLRSQSATSNWGGNRYNSYAFTEQGVAMLSSVLKSPSAVEVNIQIMRAFVAMRHITAQNKSVEFRLQTIESELDTHNKQIESILKSLCAITKMKATSKTILSLLV